MGITKILMMFAVFLAGLFFAPKNDGLWHTPEVFAWTRTATFESGTSGKRASGTSGFDYAGPPVTYSVDTAAVGSKSAKFVWNAGSDGSAQTGEIEYASVGVGGELWARAYFYFKSPWSWTSRPVVKIFRGAQITSGGRNVGYLSVFADSSGSILLSNEPGDVQTATGATWSTDKWQCVEMYVKLGSPGIFRIWKDGVLVYEDTTHNTASGSQATTRALFGSYWNGGVPKNQTEYIDDVVITTDRPSQQDSHGNYMIGPRRR